MSSARYWIWFQKCLGVAKNFAPLVEYFGSVEEIYNSNFLQRSVCPHITKRLLEKMEENTIEEADKIIERCENEGWKIITYDDVDYPKKLKNIFDPPAVLYVCGEMPDFDNNLSIGVVGTRKSSPYALAASRVISKGIARCNGIIVSGGALGIDSSSHEGALEAKGKTVVVLGCGLGTNYLVTNMDLRRKVSIEGAIITEYQPDTPATKYSFPPRNRIISGLSDGVFVAEASDKSGSLITASYATDQNRDLYAIPASIFDEKFSGTNRLIEDGAVPVTSLKVILEPYKSKYKTLDLSKMSTIKELLSDEYENNVVRIEDEEQLTFENVEEHREKRYEMDKKAMNISGNEKVVYLSLDNSFKDIDLIARETSLEVKDVLMSLTMLELDGLAEAGIGKRYRLKQS